PKARGQERRPRVALPRLRRAPLPLLRGRGKRRHAVRREPPPRGARSPPARPWGAGPGGGGGPPSSGGSEAAAASPAFARERGAFLGLAPMTSSKPSILT